MIEKEEKKKRAPKRRPPLIRARFNLPILLSLSAFEGHFAVSSSAALILSPCKYRGKKAIYVALFTIKILFFTKTKHEGEEAGSEMKSGWRVYIISTNHPILTPARLA